MLNFNGTNAMAAHTLAAPTTYPYTDLIWAKIAGYTGNNQSPFSEVEIAAGRRVKMNVYQNGAISNLTALSLSSWGGAPTPSVNEVIDTTGDAAAEPIMVVHNSASSITLYTKNFASGTNDTQTNALASEWAAANTLLTGAVYVDGAYANWFSGALGERARWHGVALTAGDFATLASGAAPETVSPGDIYDVWDMNPAGAPGTSVTGDLVGRVNGLIMTLSGGVTKAALTHPITRASAPTLTSPVGKQMTGGFFDLSGGTA